MRQFDRRRMQKAFGVLLVVSTLMIVVPLTAIGKSLTRKDAMVIAEATEVVRGFYELRDGTLQNCIEKKVVRPCDSGWVQCIDDAWVVQFFVGETCPVDHDGRLLVAIVVNSLTGDIISRFPEKEFFEKDSYCHSNSDCVYMPGYKEQGGQAQLSQCMNFMAGQQWCDDLEQCPLLLTTEEQEVNSTKYCHCLANNCVLTD